MQRHFFTFILLLACALLVRPGAVRAAACDRSDALFRSGFEACGNRSESAFIALGQDELIGSAAARPVLSHLIELDEAATIFVVADGRQLPTGASAGRLWLTVNGAELPSSRSVMDWRESNRRAQHAFRLLGTTALPAGQHRVALVALAGPRAESTFVVGSGSALAIFVDPRSELVADFLPGDSPPVDVNTYRPAIGIDINEGDPDRPWLGLLANRAANDASEAAVAVSLVAGHARNACAGLGDDGFGDALWGFWTDGVCPSTDEASWGVNDLDPSAELQAPMVAHAARVLAPGEAGVVAWGASELAFGSDQAGSPSGAHENEVCYRASDVAMVTAIGTGMIGAAPIQGAPAFCSTYVFRCVASTEGFDGCPEPGRWVVLGVGELAVPAGHDGRVYFSAVTRIQGDGTDGDTTVRLRLRVDGRLVGSVGVQELIAGAGQASRTLSSSWLAAGDEALAPGMHRVEAVIQVTGEQLRFPSVPRELPLVWFD